METDHWAYVTDGNDGATIYHQRRDNISELTTPTQMTVMLIVMIVVPTLAMVELTKFRLTTNPPSIKLN